MKTGFSNLEKLLTDFMQADNEDYEEEELYSDDVGTEDPRAEDDTAADAETFSRNFPLLPINTTAWDLV